MKNLSDINVIKSVMGRHGVTFNKGLGQNFLVDPAVCPAMAEAAGLDENTCAIEIGPGVGVLTAELAKRAGKVLSFEVDNRLLPVLDETLSEFDNVEIINQDVMKADLKGIIEEKCKGMEIADCIRGNHTVAGGGAELAIALIDGRKERVGRVANAFQIVNSCKENIFTRHDAVAAKSVADAKGGQVG